MRTNTIVSRQTLALLVGLCSLETACGTGPVEVDTQESQQPILDGQLEPGVPSVLLLTDQPSGANDTCTATMLSPTVAITAKHCNDDHRGMILDVGSKSTGFVDHLVDIAIAHPDDVDLMLVHTSNPVFTAPGKHVGDIAVDSYMVVSSNLPSKGDGCVAVGYGAHDPTPGDPGGARYKRSGAETVTKVDTPNTAFSLVEANSTYADVPPGRTAGGDSGGPIVCNNNFVAINDLGHTANDLVALDIDVPWVNDNINLDVPTPTDSLYIIRGAQLLRASKLGAYEGIGSDDWSTATSMAAFPSSTSDIYIIANNNMYRVTKDGVSTQIGPPGVWTGSTLLTTSGAYLYAIQSGCLFRVNPRDGTYPAPLGTCDWTSATSMGNDRGLLYVVNNGYLYSASAINGSHGILSVHGTTRDWSGPTKMVTSNDVLYIQQADNVWQITNRSTGAFTPVTSGWTGSTTMAALDGLLFLTGTPPDHPKLAYLFQASIVGGGAKKLAYHDWAGARLSIAIPP
jgi:hypothetical protein